MFESDTETNTNIPNLGTKVPRARAAGIGRKKGTPNKCDKTARENIMAVFNRLGGTAEMARWARKNQTEFYKLYARLIPVQLNATGNALTGPVTLQVAFVSPEAKQIGQTFEISPQSQLEAIEGQAVEVKP